MNHLQQAQYAIDDAQKRAVHEQAMLATQRAIAHAMIALVERMDKMLKYDLEHGRYELLPD